LPGVKTWTLLLLCACLNIQVWAQPPVFAPTGAEGIDLKTFDARRRAPTFRFDQAGVTVQVPLARPEKLPRTLQRVEFRYVGVSSLGVRHQDGSSREYYCPGRLIKAHKMEEWLSGTPMVIGSYEGAEGKPAVVSLLPETLTPLPDRPFSTPTGWSLISPTQARELVLRSPTGDCFACICPAAHETVVFDGQTVAAISQAGLNLYEQADSDWRVVCCRRPDALYILVVPTQDYPVMLESLSSFWLQP